MKGNSITNYWLKYYINKDLCCLCGNTGVIDTRGIKSPANIECGKISWCICPNGQTLRKQSKSDPIQNRYLTNK